MKKKQIKTDAALDFTMGSYDGAELCEIIRIYIQSLFINIFSKDNME